MKIDGNFIVRQKSDTIPQKIDLKSQVFGIEIKKTLLGKSFVYTKNHINKSQQKI